MYGYLLTETTMFPVTTDSRIAAVFLLYLISSVVWKIRSHLTLGIALLLMLSMFFSYMVVGSSVQTERLAVWTVLFFLFGITQQGIEIYT